MEHDNSFSRIAHELALNFMNESDIPTRFKKTSSKKHNYDPNSASEQNFQQEVSGWRKTIESIFNYCKEENQGWRLVRLTPYIEPTTNSVTKNQDFLDFLDILIQRRDVDNCDSDELGKMCMLHTAFQKEVEKQLT